MPSAIGQTDYVPGLQPGDHAGFDTHISPRQYLQRDIGFGQLRLHFHNQPPDVVTPIHRVVAQLMGRHDDRRNTVIRSELAPAPPPASAQLADDSFGTTPRR